ncbi:hypothetical protein GQX74_000946 [Glossina fuscipes]|nr:hypothetical protein GQX74_000946 [Glossina fuscipes]
MASKVKWTSENNDYNETPSDKTPPGFPVITQGPSTRVIEVGHTPTMQCKAVGNPPPTIYWIKNQTKVDMSNPRYSIKDGTLKKYFFTGIAVCLSIAFNQHAFIHCVLSSWSPWWSSSLSATYFLSTITALPSTSLSSSPSSSPSSSSPSSSSS